MFPLQTPTEKAKERAIQHSKELSRLKAMIDDLVIKQESMDKRLKIMDQKQDQKQDQILKYLISIITNDISCLESSVTDHDIAKAMATTPTASVDEKSTTTLGAGYKQMSSGSKKSSSSHSDSDKKDDDDIDTVKEDNDDDKMTMIE